MQTMIFIMFETITYQKAECQTANVKFLKIKFGWEMRSEK